MSPTPRRDEDGVDYVQTALLTARLFLGEADDDKKIRSNY